MRKNSKKDAKNALKAPEKREKTRNSDPLFAAFSARIPRSARREFPSNLRLSRSQV